MGTKKVRKGPTASATAFSVGTKKKGSDGNYWIVVATKANVHKWQKIKNLTNLTNSTNSIKTTLKKKKPSKASNKKFLLEWKLEMRKKHENWQKKDDKFKYNKSKTSSMKKCHDFCKNDYVVQMEKNAPAYLKRRRKTNNKIDEKMRLDSANRYCRRDFCNENCAEGIIYYYPELEKSFRKTVKNGFVDSYSPDEIEMLKNKGALSGCTNRLKHKLVPDGYDLFAK